MSLEYNYLSVSELKMHNHTRMHLKSDALAKGGTLKAILSEVAITRARCGHLLIVGMGHSMETR